MTRDFQQSNVYAAERAIKNLLDKSYTTPVVELYGSKVVLPGERKFADIQSVQRYCDQLMGFDWMRNSYPRASLSVKIKAARSDSRRGYHYPMGRVITLPIKSRQIREETVLHELSHHLDPNPGHGPVFVRTLTHLFTEVLGEEIGWLFQMFCYEEGVTN